MKASCDDLNVVKQDNMSLPWAVYMYKIMDMVINEKKGKKHIEENKGKQQCVFGSASRIRLPCVYWIMHAGTHIHILEDTQYSIHRHVDTKIHKQRCRFIHADTYTRTRADCRH